MRLAIVGATGEVGRMMLKVLEERNIPISDLHLYASSRSAGTFLKYQGEEIEVRELSSKAMERSYDYLLFSAGKKVSSQFAPIAEQARNTIIDNSSAFRQTHPLIVPEINGKLLKGYQGIIANPNCSTIQLVLALYPLHLRYVLQEIVISTYQSVSGAGNRGIQALNKERSKSGMDKDEFRLDQIESPFPTNIDLNVIPQIGKFDKDGYSEEEHKMIMETRKILGIEDLKVAVTTVRVPVLFGHAETVFARFENPVHLPEISDLYKAWPVITYQQNGYMTPREIDESEQSHIGRMRRGGDDYTLLFWNVAHNVRLGAATNAVKIMQLLMALRVTR